jgi:hypothetical protein
MKMHLDLIAELSALNVAFWQDVDHNWGRTAHEFFVEEDALYATPDPLEGRQAIRDFYSWREGRGSRIARHCIVNFHAAPDGDNRATCDWILLLHAADGEPVLPTAPPILIADFRDVCARGADGRWLYESRTLTPIFKGGAPVTLPPEK